MLWIGFTGGIASGKSTFCQFLEELNKPVIYADRLAHEALLKESPVFTEIVEHFGSVILSKDGEIDRKSLGTLIFSDKDQRSWLESRVHPYVQSQVARRREALAEKGNLWAVYEVPLLFEKNMQGQFHRTVALVSHPSLQIKRLIQYRSLSQQEAENRLSTQISNAEKKNWADYTIENDGSLESLKQKLQGFLSQVDEWVSK